jgi:HlyD family secretion protein
VLILAGGALALRPSPVPVEVAAVGRGPLQTIVAEEAVTRVRERFTVAAPVTGRLARITLREGDLVRSGEAVAYLTPAPIDPRGAAQARSALLAAEARAQETAVRIAEARASLAQARRDARRMRVLADAGAVSDRDSEQAQLAVSLRQAELAAAESAVRAARAEAGTARAALLGADAGRAEAPVPVRAPGGGRVLRLLEPSERVVAAGSPLLEIGDARSLELVANVLSEDAVGIRPGTPVRVERWGGTAALSGRVRLVEPAGFERVSALGVEEQRVRVVIELDRVPAALGDGYRVEVRIVTWAAPGVVKIPTSALVRDGSRWSVFVARDGRARRRPVRVGHRGESETEVLAGVSPGERVVLYPDDRIAEGVRVRTPQPGRKP